MGSFSEIVLSFYLREDTPDPVLAAFSALAQPLPEGAYWGPAPQLPEPVVEAQDDWEPDWREAGWPAADEFASEPWRHEWATWLSIAMGVMTVPSAALVWAEAKRWHLAVRCSWKTGPDTILDALGWIGPFVHRWGNDDAPPTLIGHISDEYSPRPYLLWCQRGQVTMENLNPDQGY